MAASGWYSWDRDDLILQVRVQPRAGRTEIADIREDKLRIRLSAAPTDGKANAQLCQLLAAAFAIPKSRVTVIQGQTSRDKRLRIGAPRRLLAGIHLPEKGQPEREHS